MTRLDIVIVSYNARADLERCLDSLVGSPPRVAHGIVVVDNASVDGSAAMVRSRFHGVRLIEAGDNLGFARANNVGIRQSSSELVMLLNGDTIIPAGTIDRLVEKLDHRPDVAVIGPRIVDGNGRAELSFGRMISPWNELRQRILVRGNERGTRVVVSYVDRLTRHEHDVDWVSGACLLVRRRDAESVGLLDERYFMYAEDVDFCAAVRSCGRRVLFAPEVEIVHLRGRSRQAAPRTSMDAYRRSHVAFYEKHHPAWAAALRLYLRIRRNSPDIPEEPVLGTETRRRLE
jgi:N-acetylglucosaminyl-diphospho-decaprenol L-rhamnosyltransferase